MPSASPRLQTWTWEPMTVRTQILVQVPLSFARDRVHAAGRCVADLDTAAAVPPFRTGPGKDGRARGVGFAAALEAGHLDGGRCIVRDDFGFGKRAAVGVC